MLYLVEIIWKNVGKYIGFLLRCIEVILCLRKKPYKSHTFKKKGAFYEYYHNKLKFKKHYV